SPPSRGQLAEWWTRHKFLITKVLVSCSFLLRHVATRSYCLASSSSRSAWGDTAPPETSSLPSGQALPLTRSVRTTMAPAQPIGRSALGSGRPGRVYSPLRQDDTLPTALPRSGGSKGAPMRVCLFEDRRVEDLEPLTLTRPAHDLLCG